MISLECVLNRIRNCNQEVNKNLNMIITGFMSIFTAYFLSPRIYNIFMLDVVFARAFLVAGGEFSQGLLDIIINLILFIVVIFMLSLWLKSLLVMGTILALPAQRIINRFLLMITSDKNFAIQGKPSTSKPGSLPLYPDQATRTAFFVILLIITPRLSRYGFRTLFLRLSLYPPADTLSFFTLALGGGLIIVALISLALQRKRS